MLETEDIRLAGVQRRRLVFDAALLAGATVLLGLGASPSRAVAGAKLAQNEIGYQNTPKGPQRCELCVNWSPPASCKLVAGAISSTGWCGLFVRKP